MEKHANTPGQTLTLLHAKALGRVCRFGHLAPSSDLQPYVAVAWTMDWKLADSQVYPQQVLPNPCVHIVVSTERDPEILGVVTGAFSVDMVGEVFVFGVRFRPCGFHAFVRQPVCAYTDKRATLFKLFPNVNLGLLRDLSHDRDSLGLLSAIERELRQLAPTAEDPIRAELEELIERLSVDREMLTVEHAARSLGTSPRTLQRLFRTYVGVGPKWVIRRFRLKEAAARAEAGEEVLWADLAGRLGYFDQAHLIKDFKRLVGQTPAAYVKLLGR